eukprot:TRINITY_DN3277_c0_g1_i1.p1 TRINITY_DN3277_c0_g1~~TRINITY_DN3277_c0_g1_i1.p1  ORF type:complete len:315 (+),score=72.06 TRINITY_DN3277_c0_g1_i1:52-996(+)
MMYIYSLSVVVGVLAILIFYWTYPKLVVERVQVNILDLPSPLKIVQLTDIHYDTKITEDMLDKVVEIVNKEENVDFVMLTGDLIDLQPEPIHHLCRRWLSRLKSKYGTLAVLGNHDHKLPHSTNIVTAALESIHVRVLDNETFFPFGQHHDDPSLQIVGMGDYSSRHFDIEKVANELSDSSHPRIILSHNPDTADILKKYRADLIIAGHTHGGQIVLPFLGSPLPFLKKIITKLPASLLPFLPFYKFTTVVRNWKWLSGLHSIDRSLSTTSINNNNNNGINQMYISRGLGSHGGVRLNCNPEVTILTLIPYKHK